MQSIREARLRPEHVRLYPDLSPGVWVPATVLKDRRTGSPSRARPLDEAHFEFRDRREDALA